jgi:hypothetical protein
MLAPFLTFCTACEQPAKFVVAPRFTAAISAFFSELALAAPRGTAAGKCFFRKPLDPIARLKELFNKTSLGCLTC